MLYHDVTLQTFKTLNFEIHQTLWHMRRQGYMKNVYAPEGRFHGICVSPEPAPECLQLEGYPRV